MPRTFSRSFAAVVGAVVLAAGIGTAAFGLGRYGNDISWPQCGGAFPTQAGFGIIGVTGGRPFTQNPCLAQEWQWALSNRGAPAYYMNISDPGTADPSGYGASAAAYALNYASSATGASSAVNHVWWIDVETANTWSSNQAANAALIQGALTYLKQQSSPERIKMLLKIADHFAAPFGTEEWLLNYYGVKDVDFRFGDTGAPNPTDQGRAELTATWRYISSPPYALYDTVRSQEFASVTHAAEEAMLAALQLDPTLGLYSQAAFNVGIPAQTTLYAGVSDIVQGRRPISELESLVADWRTAGGDKMRAEYQEAMQAKA